MLVHSPCRSKRHVQNLSHSYPARITSSTKQFFSVSSKYFKSYTPDCQPCRWYNDIWMVPWADLKWYSICFAWVDIPRLSRCRTTWSLLLQYNLISRAVLCLRKERLNLLTSLIKINWRRQKAWRSFLSPWQERSQDSVLSYSDRAELQFIISNLTLITMPLKTRQF